LRPTFYCEILPSILQLHLVGLALTFLIFVPNRQLWPILLRLASFLSARRRSSPLPHWCRHCLRHRQPRLLLVHLRLVCRIVLARTRSCTLRTCYATIRCVPAGP